MSAHSSCAKGEIDVYVVPENDKKTRDDKAWCRSRARAEMEEKLKKRHVLLGQMNEKRPKTMLDMCQGPGS